MNYFININLNPNYKLKGCNIKYINDIAKRKIEDYNININNIIDDKIYEILSNYSVKDCIRLILLIGNFYDAFLRCKTTNNHFPNNLIDNDNNIYDNTILFHRRLAFDYVKEIILNKILYRINEILNFQDIINNQHLDKTCSICLELVTNSDEDNWFISKCNHLFHRKCIFRWKKNNCPICRKRNYK